MTDVYCPCCEVKYLDLGWHNNPHCRPAIDAAIKRCTEKKHLRRDADVGGGQRGLEHVVSCKECKFVYRYDSSD